MRFDAFMASKVHSNVSLLQVIVTKGMGVQRRRPSGMKDTYLLPYLLNGAESFLRSYLVLQLIKKFPAFYGTRKFITILTSARHLSLS